MDWLPIVQIKGPIEDQFMLPLECLPQETQEGKWEIQRKGHQKENSKQCLFFALTTTCVQASTDLRSKTKEPLIIQMIQNV